MLHLQNDFCKLSVAPERGAIVTSLSVRGHEVLYLDGSTFEDPTKNVRGGIPVLFPICGPLAEADYLCKGKRFAMKQHGFARNQAWAVVERGVSRVVLELCDNEATRAQYPFSFVYRLALALREDGLSVEQSLSNLGEEPMPAQWGFHPYFLVAGKERLQFDLPVTEYRDNKSPASGPFLGFDFAQPEIDWAFPHPTAGQASFRDPERGLQVTVRYDQIYQCLVFWTLQDQPFICLEPWSSGRLAFPDGAEVHRLEPRHTLRCGMEILVSVDSDHQA